MSLLAYKLIYRHLHATPLLTCHLHLASSLTTPLQYERPCNSLPGNNLKVASAKYTLFPKLYGRLSGMVILIATNLLFRRNVIGRTSYGITVFDGQNDCCLHLNMSIT